MLDRKDAYSAIPQLEKKIDAIMCIVDLIKKDSEIKILLGCTEEEKTIIYETHNETQFMKGVLIRR